MDVEQLQRLGSKFLSRNDVENQMAYPVRLTHHIWGPEDPPKKSFRVLDRFGVVWELQGRMRRDPQGHPKPELCGPQWKRFVLMNHLRPGDELVFYRAPVPNLTQVTFVVSFKREITLLGRTFSGHTTPV